MITDIHSVIISEVCCSGILNECVTTDSTSERGTRDDTVFSISLSILRKTSQKHRTYVVSWQRTPELSSKDSVFWKLRTVSRVYDTSLNWMKGCQHTMMHLSWCRCWMTVPYSRKYCCSHCRCLWRSDSGGGLLKQFNVYFQWEEHIHHQAYASPENSWRWFPSFSLFLLGWLVQSHREVLQELGQLRQ